MGSVRFTPVWHSQDLAEETRRLGSSAPRRRANSPTARSILRIPGQRQPVRGDVVRARQKKKRRQKRLGLHFSWIDNLGDGEDLNVWLLILRCLGRRIGEDAVGRTQIDADDVPGILQ